MTKAREPDGAAVGRCATCRHASTRQSARGSVFWRCRLADRDPAYPRYPALPVRICAGHEPRAEE